MKMNSNDKKGGFLDRDILLEQCRLGYEELKAAKADFNKYGLAGFSGFMIIAGLLAAHSDIFYKKPEDPNPYVSFIFLIIPILAAIYILVSHVIAGRYAISQWWLVYRLRSLDLYSSILKNDNSFFLIFYSDNEAWKGVPKMLKKSEIATTFTYWVVVFVTSIFSYAAYVALTIKDGEIIKLHFLVAFLFSLMVFAFANVWVFRAVRFYLKKASEFHNDFISKNTVDATDTVQQDKSSEK